MRKWKLNAGCTQFLEQKTLWGHRWTLCNAYIYKDDAESRKKILESKGKISRIQSLNHIGGKVYLVWWR
jgi:hypothetical protein